MLGIELKSGGGGGFWGDVDGAWNAYLSCCTTAWMLDVAVYQRLCVAARFAAASRYS